MSGSARSPASGHCRRSTRPTSNHSVSHVRTDFNDGENYFKLHGERIWVPASREDRPGKGYLEWHNENQFRE